MEKADILHIDQCGTLATTVRISLNNLLRRHEECVLELERFVHGIRRGIAVLIESDVADLVDIAQITVEGKPHKSAWNIAWELADMAFHDLRRAKQGTPRGTYISAGATV